MPTDRHVPQLKPACPASHPLPLGHLAGQPRTRAGRRAGGCPSVRARGGRRASAAWAGARREPWARGPAKTQPLWAPHASAAVGRSEAVERGEGAGAGRTPVLLEVEERSDYKSRQGDYSPARNLVFAHGRAAFARISCSRGARQAAFISPSFVRGCFTTLTPRRVACISTTFLGPHTHGRRHLSSSAA
jgi:hypothetical protein